MLAKKAYKVRLYPTATQEAELLRILVGCRLVWNHFLTRIQDNFSAGNRAIPFRVLSRELTTFRKDQAALAGIQLAPLAQSLRRLRITYSTYYRKQGGLPQIKGDSPISQSFQKCGDWRIIGNRVSVQNNLVIKTRGLLPPSAVKPKTLVVKYIAGVWYATVFVDEEIPVSGRHTKSIGIDVGLSSLAITSTGEKFDAFKPAYVLHHRMRKLQQKLARQQFDSKRREQTKRQIARLWLKISNCRTNHLHQTSHAVLAKSPSLIVLEDLNVSGMMKNHKLARSLADVSLGEFHRQLRYKQVWRGGKVVTVDRFFPSTKTCSECGWVNNKLTLATRNWTCAGCGAEHDRDINAAKNLLKQGRGTPSVEVARALPMKRRLVRDTDNRRS